MWSFGINTNGQLGRQVSNDAHIPTIIPSLNEPIQKVVSEYNIFTILILFYNVNTVYYNYNFILIINLFII